MDPARTAAGASHRAAAATALAAAQSAVVQRETALKGAPNNAAGEGETQIAEMHAMDVATRAIAARVQLEARTLEVAPVATPQIEARETGITAASAMSARRSQLVRRALDGEVWPNTGLQAPLWVNESSNKKPKSGLAQKSDGSSPNARDGATRSPRATKACENKPVKRSTVADCHRSTPQIPVIASRSSGGRSQVARQSQWTFNAR